MPTAKKGMKKNYYVIGIGGYGSKLAEEISQRIKKDCSSVFSVAIDTDYDEINSVCTDYKFDLSSFEDFSKTLEDLQKKDIEFFLDNEAIELNYAKILTMNRGSSLWRMKAYISFVKFLTNEQNKKQFDDFIEKIASDKEEESEIYFVGSLAGGTSSALMLPIALYLRKSFRELNYKKFKTIFFASSPDIFALSLNGELKTKAFANAYATLAEINTVNMVANRRDKKDLVLGGKNMPFGILFDGTSDEYDYKECAPFNDVVMFDRMPSVTSVEAFRSIVCTYVYYYYLGLVSLTKNKSFNGVDIYSGYSVSELNYSLDDTVEFVSKYVTAKKLKDEIIRTYNEIKKTENIEVFKNNKLSDTEKFARQVEDYVTNLHDEKLDRPALLLGRGEEYEVASGIMEDEWISKYFDKIKLYLSEKIDEEEKIIDLKNKLKKSFFNKEENLKINFTVKGRKAKKKEFTDYYKNLFNQLIETTNELINKSFLEQKIEKLIIKNGELSIKNIIIEGNKFVHPTLAFIKLSRLLNFFSGKKRAYSLLSELEIGRCVNHKEFPSKLYDYDNHLLGGRGYGKLPIGRLNKTFIPEENAEPIEPRKKIKNIYKIYNPKIDETFILSDINNVYENVKKSILGIYISKIVLSISNLIDNYCKLFDGAKNITKSLEKKLNELIQENGVQSGFYEVRSSREQRILDATTYQKEMLYNLNFDMDEIYGRNAFEYATSCDLSDGTNDRFMANILEALSEQIIKSEFYEKLSAKNVISAMGELRDINLSNSTLNKACKIRPVLITENRPTEIEKRTLYISKEVAEYVCDNAKELMLREKSLTGAVEELLSGAGDYETQVQIYEGLEKTKAFVVAEKSAINLASITKVKCEDAKALYKAEYDKAIKNKQEYCTEMWNPHLFEVSESTKLSNV